MDGPASAPARSRHHSGLWDGAALHEAFARASTTRSWTVGYRSFDRDRVEGTAQLSGTWPDELRGQLYRNGPARHERGGLRYAHRWDGDGLLQRFDLSSASVRHIARYVETAKYRRDSAKGAIVTSGFGTKVPGSAVFDGDVDEANAANINVVKFGDELLALWEAGSAYRVDPIALDTRGPKVWSDRSRSKPFSAHPRMERDGTMWNFGVDPIADELLLYRIAPDGQLLDLRTVHIERIAPVHDFALTRRYLVFLLPSLTLSRDRLEAGKSFAEACQWSPDLGMRVLVVDKNDWSTRRFELDAGCLFHVAQAWEDNEGRVNVEYMRSDNPLPLLTGWSVMRGEYRHQPGARLTLASIDLSTGTATQRIVGERDAEFPVVSPADVGGRAALMLCLERTGDRPSDIPDYDTVALHPVDGHTTRHVYGNDYLVEEHLFAGQRDGVAPRWIVGTALDLRSRQTVLSVFDVTGLGDGPIAQARLPYAMPVGLHGSYVAC